MNQFYNLTHNLYYTKGDLLLPVSEVCQLSLGRAVTALPKLLCKGEQGAIPCLHISKERSWSWGRTVPLAFSSRENACWVVNEHHSQDSCPGSAAFFRATVTGKEYMANGNSFLLSSLNLPRDPAISLGGQLSKLDHSHCLCCDMFIIHLVMSAIGKKEVNPSLRIQKSSLIPAL